MNPDVMIRQNSPSATFGPLRAAFWRTESPPTLPPTVPPDASVAKNASTFIPISVYVAIGSPPAYARRTTRVFSREHSAERMPTDVGVMQSGQIARPQFEHDTAVSRLGCRYHVGTCRR